MSFSDAGAQGLGDDTRDLGAHGMPGFEKGSCKINALSGTHWALGNGRGREAREENIYLVTRQMFIQGLPRVVLFLPPGTQ